MPEQTQVPENIRAQTQQQTSNHTTKTDICLEGRDQLRNRDRGANFHGRRAHGDASEIRHSRKVDVNRGLFVLVDAGSGVSHDKLGTLGGCGGVVGAYGDVW